jgi:hypothetical protein
MILHTKEIEANVLSFSQNVLTIPHKKQDITRGFRMLTLGWSDGKTFMPIDFFFSALKKAKSMASTTIDKRFRI